MSVDMPQCYREQQRKARKQHRCCECKGDINAGEKYVYISGVWEYVPDDYRHCMHCHGEWIRVNALSDGPGEEGPGLGALYEWMRDCEIEARGRAKE